MPVAPVPPPEPGSSFPTPPHAEASTPTAATATPIRPTRMIAPIVESGRRVRLGRRGRAPWFHRKRLDAFGRARLGTMRALRKTEPRPGAELVDVPVPDPGEGEVLVRVHAASICGTDLHIYDWNEWAAGRIRAPMTFGHELAGHVAAVGPEVHHVQPGAFVAAETHIACGHCSTCRTGRAHICE